MSEALEDQHELTAQFESLQREQWADPHPLYHRARAESPLLFMPQWDNYIAFRYDDCERVLRDPLFSSNPEHQRRDDGVLGAIGADGEAATLMDGLSSVLLFLDPPDHTRLRRLVSKAFTPRAVEQLRGHVTELVRGLLDEVDGAGTFDLMATLAYPLPVTVICELLGVPLDDRDSFGPLSSDASRLLDGDIDEATMNRGVGAILQLVAYFAELFEERRRSPRDDMISALLAVEEEGDRLTIDELHSIVLLLFAAGHETTMNLIGNGAVALLRNRAEWDRLRADASLAPSAVEEILRFDGPVHVTGRTATQDLSVGDLTIEKGQHIGLVLAAANRDPARFSEPDRLDIGRDEGAHLTFSHGIHYCLGAALARLEGQEAFLALTRRFPNLELAEEPVHRDHFVLRGYQAVLVTT